MDVRTSHLFGKDLRRHPDRYGSTAGKRVTNRRSLSSLLSTLLPITAFASWSKILQGSPGEGCRTWTLESWGIYPPTLVSHWLRGHWGLRAWTGWHFWPAEVRPKWDPDPEKTLRQIHAGAGIWWPAVLHWRRDTIGAPATSILPSTVWSSLPL